MSMIGKIVSMYCVVCTVCILTACQQPLIEQFPDIYTVYSTLSARLPYIPIFQKVAAGTQKIYNETKSYKIIWQLITKRTKKDKEEEA